MNEGRHAEAARSQAMILLTDGVDIGSDATLQDAIEAAQRTDTLVYSILFSDLHAYEWGVPEGARALLRISKQTGGRAAMPAPSR